MAIKEHPRMGTILMCDFSHGFVAPEMTKRRPVLVLSPKIAGRGNLCTIVALSTTTPQPAMGYHCQVDFDPPLPEWLASEGVWVKADMIYSVSLCRLDFVTIEKDQFGRRVYYLETISDEQLCEIRRCVLRGLGLASLTKHL